MRATSRHVKLGLLAVLGACAVIAVTLVLGLQKEPTVRYHTYFDESVQGLDEGAIVKYRGVRIGKVARIGVAPDRRLIDVEIAIERVRAKELRLVDTAGLLRAQLVIFGITGVKLIDLDFADANTPRPPPLSFRPAAHFIPSRPSLLGALGDDLKSLAHRLPRLADHAIGTLASIDDAMKDVRDFLATSKGTVASIGRVASAVDRAKVTRSVASTLAFVDDVGRRALDATDELGNTVHDVGEAARALREFLDALEREPDMMVKGRARAGRRR